MRRLLVLSALVLVLSSCQVRPHLAASPPPLEHDGAVFVYLEPLPQEAEGLSFVVSEMYAERADGVRVPVPVLLSTIDPGSAGRERLIAHGVLPPGAYAGLSMRIREAALSGEKGTAALRVPEEIGGIPISFRVESRRAVVVSLSLDVRKSLREGFRFSPAFSGSIPMPGMLAAGRIGMSTCTEGNVVTVFDKVSGTVISVIPTGESPWGVAVDSARHRGYVSLSGEDAVEVIDLLELRVLDRLRLAGGDAPRDLALTPDGTTLLVADSGSNTVSVIDTAAFLERDRILVGTAPQSVLLDSTGRRAYVFNELSNSISVLDVPRAMVAATISTESGPVRGSLNREESRLYVLQRGSPYLGIVDTFALTMTRGAYLGNGATAIKVDTGTGWIYLSRRGSDEVEEFDPSGLLPMDFVPVGGEAAYLAIDGEEHNLWIVLPGSNRLLAVDLVNRKKTLAIDVGEGPHRVAVMGEK